MHEESKSQFEQRIFDQYFEALVRLAGARLGRQHGRVADGEDIAISAIGSFLDRYGDDSQVRLQESDSLWRIIAKIAQRKALNHVRHHNRVKRGEGKVRGNSAFERPNDSAADHPTFPSTQPTPDSLVQSCEIVEHLFSQLTPELSSIAQQKLEGFTNQEIAQELDCSVATIERRLKIIRSIWEEHTP